MNKRIINYILGILLISLGVAFTIQSQLAPGAYDELALVIARYLEKIAGITDGGYTIALLVMAFLFVIPGVVMLKNKTYLFALAAPFLFGPIIELMNHLIPTQYNAVMQYVFILIGVLIIALGVVFVIKANFPPTPSDIFMLTLKDVFSFKTFGTAKILAELILYIVGALLGVILLGDNVSDSFIKLGTIIVTFTIGPAINLQVYLVAKIESKFKKGA